MIYQHKIFCSVQHYEPVSWLPCPTLSFPSKSLSSTGRFLFVWLVFSEIDKLNLEFIWKCKGIRNWQGNPEEEEAQDSDPLKTMDICTSKLKYSNITL